MKKIIFIFLGTLSLVIGIIGIFVPGLPTTAFLLLTAALYMRSSERLYNMLLANKFFGPYILEFRKNKGMTRRMKIHSIGTMWFMITISCVFFIKPVSVILVVIGVGIIGTVVMGWIVPTAGK